MLILRQRRLIKLDDQGLNYKKKVVKSESRKFMDFHFNVDDIVNSVSDFICHRYK